MTAKLLATVACTVLLTSIALAQDGHLELKLTSAPSLRILSAPEKLDREKRRVTLILEIENSGDKTIKGFGWLYKTQDVIRDYNVSITANMPDVSVVLAPKERKKVVVLQDAQVPEFILSMPDGEIEVVSVIFEDGSVWNRSNEK